MRSKSAKILTVGIVFLLYAAMCASFILSEVKERAEDEELVRGDISIDFYMRTNYWDYVGIAFFLLATITAFCAYRYFRREERKLSFLKIVE